MGKLDTSKIRFITREQLRVLIAIENGLRQHEIVPRAVAIANAHLKYGGTQKIMKELCKLGLLSYERGRKYDGYRLTNLGYDSLAIKNLTDRNLINFFGNQIGTGKESNVYIVKDENDEELCLKLHRLGRICFRKIKEKRDYLRQGKAASWLYLSRISATKEYAYMLAFYNRNFPVPRPVGYNRHCVVMELIKGVPLRCVHELQNVEKLFDELMNVIVLFAEHGVIHGDFNEFNIMIMEDERPIIIDFPQMISTSHPNAKILFERDVSCIKKFFKNRFHFESELSPEFEDIEKAEHLDNEIRCSGFTRQMAEDINDELYAENGELRKDDDSDDEYESSDGTENEESEGEPIDDACSEILNEIKELNIANPKDQEKSDSEKIFNNKLNADSDLDEMSDLCYNNFRGKDGFSVTSTIHPEEITKRIRKERMLKRKKEMVGRWVAKGVSIAATRSRRENKDVVKESTGIWGWE